MLFIRGQDCQADKKDNGLRSTHSKRKKTSH